MRRLFRYVHDAIGHPLMSIGHAAGDLGRRLEQLGEVAHEVSYRWSYPPTPYTGTNWSTGTFRSEPHEVHGRVSDLTLCCRELDEEGVEGWTDTSRRLVTCATCVETIEAAKRMSVARGRMASAA